MPGIIAKDTPLHEIVLRKYEKPAGLQGRELVRKLCLSTGLLQPGDSRDAVVDVLHCLLLARKDQKHLDSEEIQQIVVQLRKQANIPLVGVAPSNIRRQIKRLRDLFFVEKVKNTYRVTEFNKLHVLFQEKIEQFLLPSVLGRVKEYFQHADEKL
ncbi:hypothetical protein HYS48_01375 [Candidatus Woesearchaeota archaeon]|nr:hypothetical protein [Candidatus Woesearchaeota archaeon]